MSVLSSELFHFFAYNNVWIKIAVARMPNVTFILGFVKIKVLLVFYKKS